jgi:nitrite reductase (NADH) large subunit
VTDARIYAVGECAAHRGIAYGLVAPLFEQGKVWPTTWRVRHRPLPARRPPPSSRSPASTCFSAGQLHGRRGHRRDRDERPFGGVYKKLVIKDDKLVGACLYGDTVDGSWYFKLLRDGRSVPTSATS